MIELFVRLELVDERSEDSESKSEDEFVDELSTDLLDDWVSEDRMDELNNKEDAEDFVFAVSDLLLLVSNEDVFGDEVYNFLIRSDLRSELFEDDEFED